MAPRHAEIIVSELGLTSEKTNLGICVKNLARRTQQPRETDMQRLKRLARYLWGKQRVVQRFEKSVGRAGQRVKIVVQSVCCFCQFFKTSWNSFQLVFPQCFETCVFETFLHIFDLLQQKTFLKRFETLSNFFRLFSHSFCLVSDKL